MIKLIINNQELSIVTQKVVSGTHDYLTVEADFKGSAWDGLRKWVHFTMGQFNYIIPMTNDAIEASMHLDLTEGAWAVYVHGNLLEDDEVTERITTDIKYLYVDAPHDGHPFPPLTPTFEELLANQIEECKDMVDDLRRDAEAGFYADGATFFPEVNENGDISWTNDKGRENPTTRNIRGPQGLTGESGVYIGTSEPTDPNVNVWVNPQGGPGKLIVRTESSGTHQGGTWDTYTLYFDDNTSMEIRVYNGADGAGAGDMLKNTYDPNNVAQDIFAYAAALKDKTDQVGLLKGSSGNIVPAVAGTDYVTPSSLAAVATSGNYNDLSNKPSIPAALTVDAALSTESENPVQNKVVKQAIDGIQTRPNPQALTINVNGETVTYDGSQAKSVSISSGGSSGGGDTVIKRSINFPNALTFPASGGMQGVTLDVSYAGYTPLGVVGVSPPGTDTISTIPIIFFLSGNLFVGKFGNISSQQITSTYYGAVQILYKKS